MPSCAAMRNPERRLNVLLSILVAFLLTGIVVVVMLLVVQPKANSNQASAERDTTPADNPTQAPSLPLRWVGFDRSNTDILVGAYYYPWHSNDFHQGGGYLREQLIPPQQPFLGEYDDTEPATIAQHLEWSRQANIHLWVTSWWGPNKPTDVTIRESILVHPDLRYHGIAIFYESFGRIRQAEGYSTHRVYSDTIYLCQEYFSHPNYLVIDGKPVVFVYLTRKLAQLGLLDQVAALMRAAGRAMGWDDLYLVGDHTFREPPNSNAGEFFAPFDLLDAVTTYDVYGGMQGSGYVEESVVNAYFDHQTSWRILSNQSKCAYIPTVTPGFNDLGVRPEAQHAPVARQLQDGRTLLEVSLQRGRQLVDPRALHILMVNSFNEFHEDTQIEPVVGTSASGPDHLTQGVVYEGYGDKYLKILKECTSKSSSQC